MYSLPDSLPLLPFPSLSPSLPSSPLFSSLRTSLRSSPSPPSILLSCLFFSPLSSFYSHFLLYIFSSPLAFSILLPPLELLLPSPPLYYSPPFRISIPPLSFPLFSSPLLSVYLSSTLLSFCIYFPPLSSPLFSFFCLSSK